MAKQLFKMNLNDTKLGDVPMTSHDMVDLAEPPAFKQNVSFSKRATYIFCGVVWRPVTHIHLVV